MYFNIFILFNKVISFHVYLMSLFFFILYNCIYKEMKVYWQFNNTFKLFILSSYFFLFFNLYTVFIINNIWYLIFNLYYYIPKLVHTNIILNILDIYYKIFFVFNICIMFIYNKLRLTINYIPFFVLQLKIFYYVIYFVLAIIIIVINFTYLLLKFLYKSIQQLIIFISKMVITKELKKLFNILFLTIYSINENFNRLLFWKKTNKSSNKKSIKVFMKLNYSKTKRIIRDFIFRVKYRLSIMFNYLKYYFCFFLWNPIIYASLKYNINSFFYYFFSLLSIIKSSITYIKHYYKWKK